ncbi:MAG: DUF1302 domain-containing protein [Nitrospinae bacterium]|nr:DUF1302 domain-containing protein [Nitrospinota bacterium]
MNPALSNCFARRIRGGRPTNHLNQGGGFESNSRLFRLSACALALVFVLCAVPANAWDFSEGELEGSLDITLSHGFTFRGGTRDKRLIGTANGGSATSVNSDDGNLNYDSGIVSNASKFIGELDMNYRNFGAFARAHGFFDFENQSGERARNELSPEAKDLVGKDFEVLDLYLTGSFDLGGAALDLRVGNHVLSWGESTFIQNSINVINPFDVTKLRTPGAELRDGLVPVPMVSVSTALHESLSVEGFYQVKWEKTEIDPPGSFFSTSDFVGAGGRRVVLGWGAIPDTGFSYEALGPGLTQAVNADLRGFRIPSPTAPGTLTPLPQRAQPVFDPHFLNVFRNRDNQPEDAGQWGVALRYLAEGLNNTEFGIFFVNYHSRLPLLSGRTGTVQGVTDGLFAAAAVGSPTSVTTQAVTQAVTPLVTQAVTQQVTAAVTAQVPPGTPPAVIQAEIQRRVAGIVPGEVAKQVTDNVSTMAGLLAIDRYVKTAGYFAEYPEDIQLFGLSFNTVLGTSGWALQGEYSYRMDAPLQIDDAEVFFAALTPLTLDPATQRFCANAFSYCRNQVGVFAPESYVRGYIERDVSQIQATATKVFGPTLGANSLAFIAEAALMYVHDMPDRSELRLEGPGTQTSGNPFHSTAAGAHPGLPTDPLDRFASSTSYGYRMAARLDYLNAIGAVNVSPRISFQHDVKGTSPGPGGPFIEDRIAVTFGLGASYLNRWHFDVSFTMFGGADRHNQSGDRDFASATIKYLF